MTELIFTGFFQDPEVQRVCFAGFLPMYLAVVVGGVLIVVTVNVSKSLHLFLSYLFLVEISHCSTVFMKFITNLLAKMKTTSLEGCMAQIFFFHFGVTKFVVFMVMAYDQYVATCKPFYYTIIMSWPVHHLLENGSWCGGCRAITIPISHRETDYR